uniref:Uncharacterized protein n=1 Tax=Arundo donax TaxID=35708 RepID=A0A0A8ZS35_ARUDO
MVLANFWCQLIQC